MSTNNVSTLLEDVRIDSIRAKKIWSEGKGELSPARLYGRQIVQTLIQAVGVHIYNWRHIKRVAMACNTPKCVREPVKTPAKFEIYDEEGE